MPKTDILEASGPWNHFFYSVPVALPTLRGPSVSLSLILIYTQTHPTIPTLTPGPFPARAWIRGGPYNVALGSVHPLSTHTPPTLPSLQGRPSSHTLRGGLLLACPELHPPCPGLPHGEGGCSSQGCGGTAGRTQKRGQRPTYRILTWEPLRLCAEGETV